MLLLGEVFELFSYLCFQLSIDVVVLLARALLLEYASPLTFSGTDRTYSKVRKGLVRELILLVLRLVKTLLNYSLG